MKNIKLFLFLMWIPCFHFSQIKTSSFFDFEKLFEEQKKPFIVHVYTDWCSICKIESFELNKNKDVVELLNTHFYLIDFEAEKTKESIRFQGRKFRYLSNGNSGIHELALALSKNNQPIYPLWIFFDENDQLIKYHEGFMSSKILNSILESMVSK